MCPPTAESRSNPVHDGASASDAIIDLLTNRRVFRHVIDNFDDALLREFKDELDEALGRMCGGARPRQPLLSELRAAGWMVAVHNDYRLDGQLHTFWLLTHPAGLWAKGEGRTDAEALAAAAVQAKERFGTP